MTLEDAGEGNEPQEPQMIAFMNREGGNSVRLDRVESKQRVPLSESF